MIKNLFSSVGFRRVLVIFVVGLVSRSVVNYVYDINVFKEYISVVSLLYYGFMAGFSGYISELPRISFNVFKINIVRSAIRTFCNNYFLSSDKDKMFVGKDLLTKNVNKESTLVNMKDSVESDKVTAGRVKTYKSAGLRGLYGDPHNRNIVHDNSSNDYKHVSFRNRFKCKLLWSISARLSGEFNSYTEYSRSFHPDSKISLRNELNKRGVFRRLYGF